MAPSWVFGWPYWVFGWSHLGRVGFLHMGVGRALTSVRKITLQGVSGRMEFARSGEVARKSGPKQLCEIFCAICFCANHFVRTMLVVVLCVGRVFCVLFRCVLFKSNFKHIFDHH